MDRFKVISALHLGNGVVELDRRQATARETSLRHLEGDFYQVLGPIQFKTGEEIGVENVDKYLDSKLQRLTGFLDSAEEVPEEIKASDVKKSRKK
jgi:hypothetical protein